MVFWHISNIPQWFCRVEFVIIPPTFCISAIFVKYCYTTGSWLLYLMCYYTLFGLLTARGEILVKRDYCFFLCTCEVMINTGTVFTKRCVVLLHNLAKYDLMFYTILQCLRHDLYQSLLTKFTGELWAVYCEDFQENWPRVVRAILIFGCLSCPCVTLGYLHIVQLPQCPWNNPE